MPLIKPRTRGKQLVRHITKLDCENNETLYAYAHFLGEPTDYVLNQLIDTVLAKDREFQTWRAEHADSYVPRPVHRQAKGRRRDSARHTTAHDGNIATDTRSTSSSRSAPLRPKVRSSFSGPFSTSRTS